MGAFSRKTVVSVAAQIIHLVEESPDEIRGAVASSVLGQNDITEDILSTMLNGMALRTQQALRYAETTYTHGLPQGRLEVSSGNTAALETVLVGIEGTDIRLISSIVDYPIPELLAREWLIQNRSWETSTNEVVLPVGLWPPGGSTTPTLHSVTESKTTPNTYTVTYTYTDQFGVVFYPSEEVPFTTNTESLYYHVTYYGIDSFAQQVGPIKYWYYEVDTGTYPTLLPTTETTPQEPYFPIIPIRYRNQDLTRTEVRDTELFQTSEKLLKFFGMDMVKLGTDVHSSPDIGDVDHAMVHFGISVDTTTQIGTQYLYDFFSYMGARSSYGKGHFDAWVRSPKKDYPKVNSLAVKDAGFSLVLHYLYANTRILTGVVSPVGEYSKEIVQRGIIEVGGSDGFSVNQDSLYIRKQLTATTYLEVEVRGLKYENFVYQNHSVVATLRNRDNLIIPLNRFVSQAMGYKDESSLVYESMIIVFNAYERTKLEWYETEFFQIIVIIVAVVVTVSADWSGGTGLAIASALGLTGTALVIAAIVINVAISIAISYGFKILAKELGTDLSTAIAVIAFVVATYYGGLPGSGVDGAPWADELLRSSMALIEGVQANIMDDIEALQDAYDAFETDTEAKSADLARAQELLNTQDVIDPFLFTSPDFYFNPDETPEEFYNRTIHSGNVGLLGIEAVHNYVDMQLTLPKTKSTLSMSTGVS